MAEELVTVVCEHDAEVHVYRLPRALTETPEARRLLQADYRGDRDAPPACIGHDAVDDLFEQWREHRVRGKRSRDGAVFVCELGEACVCAEGAPQGCTPLGGARTAPATGETLCRCAFAFLGRWGWGACDFCFSDAAARGPGGVLAGFEALRAFWFRAYAATQDRKRRGDRYIDLPFYTWSSAGVAEPTAAEMHAALAKSCAAPAYRALCAAARDAKFEKRHPATIALADYLRTERSHYLQPRRGGDDCGDGSGTGGKGGDDTGTGSDSSGRATPEPQATGGVARGASVHVPPAEQFAPTESTHSASPAGESERPPGETKECGEAVVGTEAVVERSPRDDGPALAHLYAFDLLLLALDRQVPPIV